MSRQVVVIGGGAIGLSIAWESARRGDQVMVIEREPEVGTQTSWSAAGILPPADLQAATDPLDKLRGLSHQLFPTWAKQLSDESGIDSGFRRCGAWYLADTPGERASLIGMTHYWQALHIRCEEVGIEALRQRAPALNPEACQQTAWWVPDECQVRCPRYLQSLAAACRKRGVQFELNTEVKDLHESENSIRVDCSNATYHGDQVVVCSGAWTGRVAPGLRLQQSIVPVRGQMLLLKTGRPLMQAILNVGHRYLVFREDGHVLVGSCEEEVGFLAGTEPQTLSELQDFATKWVPALQDANVKHSWSGLRPMTFDGFPMIGKLPDSNRIYVAAGHFRSGIHLSPATAVTLVDLMHGTGAPQHTEPARHARWAIDMDAFRVGKQQTHPPR